jgi:prepilin-type processing-associated H-X9-DG protein
MGEAPPQYYGNTANFTNWYPDPFQACGTAVQVINNVTVPTQRRAYIRHNMTANYAMGDGHAKNMRPVQTFTGIVKWHPGAPTLEEMTSTFNPPQPPAITADFNCSAVANWPR